MKRSFSRNQSPRRGSAFVVVIGMLAVMILMGIAFATFIQTEQSGSTSLKNGLVARQSLNSALGRVMEAIDLSFGGVSNEWPVCVWPQPWLSSSPWEDHDYIQSARCDGRPDARIVTKEVADLLTPSQLAMARSAQVGWAPVFGGIESSSEMPWDRGHPSGDRVIGRGQYRVGGLDAGDSVIGRYAFIAIETTGLLDIDRAGGATTVSNSAWHGDPALFLLPESDKLSTTARSTRTAARSPFFSPTRTSSCPPGKAAARASRRLRRRRPPPPPRSISIRTSRRARPPRSTRICPPTCSPGSPRRSKNSRPTGSPASGCRARTRWNT